MEGKALRTESTCPRMMMSESRSREPSGEEMYSGKMLVGCGVLAVVLGLYRGEVGWAGCQLMGHDRILVSVTDECCLYGDKGKGQRI